MLQSARSVFFAALFAPTRFGRGAGLAWSHRWQRPHNLELHVSPRVRQETASLSFLQISTLESYRKVAAVGFPAYEKAHRQALVALAAKAFPRLPTEVAAQVVAFAFHVGYY